MDSMRLGAFRSSRTRHAGLSSAIKTPQFVALLGGMLVLATPVASSCASLHKCLDAHGNVGYSDTFCAGQRPQDSLAPAQRTAILTSKQIQAMLAASDQATARLDVEKMMSFFSDDARIEIVVRKGNRTGRRTLRKRELAQMAKRHKDDTSGYSLRREGMLIDITPSGTQAEVRSTLIQTWRAGDHAVTMTSDEQHLIEVRDGKPQIVYAYTITNGVLKPHR